MQWTQHTNQNLKQTKSIHILYHIVSAIEIKINNVHNNRTLSPKKTREVFWRQFLTRIASMVHN